MYCNYIADDGSTYPDVLERKRGHIKAVMYRRKVNRELKKAKSL